MQIETDVSLQPYNTFGIASRAAHFGKAHTLDDIRQAAEAGRPLFILGGGSNLLLRSDLPGLVVQNCLSGREVVEEDAASVLIAAGAGEVWHELVQWTIDRGWAGLENLSLIPGSVGAAPIQNIGAYGVELADVFERLEAIDLATGRLETFSLSDCRFGYRDSAFKNAWKGKFCIARVFLRLQKAPELRLAYGAIRDTLAEMGVSAPGIRDVSEAVIRIRRSKLPDPAVIGNSGSFFKNPELPASRFQALQARFPDIVSYPLPDGRVKLPAGWLIERCGWKGKKVGKVGCYEKQALVLVNHGGATGEEVYDLAQQIMASVEEKFGVNLSPEVNVWP